MKTLRPAPGYLLQRLYWRWALLFLGLSSLPVAMLQVFNQSMVSFTVRKAASRYKDSSQLPLSFEANQGQAAGPVRFLTRGHNYAFFLTPTEAVLSWNHEESRFGGGHRSTVPARPAPTVLRLKLIGANRQPRLSGLEALPGKSHYFVGNNPSRWKTQIETYAKVKYEEVYPGVDMVFYGHGHQLEYDFRLAPWADPEAISLHFDGASKLRLDGSGDLILRTAAGDVRQHRPVVYQEIDGIRREIASHYLLRGENQVAFLLGEYDKSQTLIIDPVISYSTFLTGTAGGARGQDIAVDASGSAYITGSTFLDYGFPGTEGGLKLTNVELPSRNYIFVAKLSPDGSNLLYSAVIGGTSPVPDPGAPGASTYLDNIGTGIAVDSAGSAYVVGSTASRNFPTTPGAIVTTYNPEPGPGEVSPKYAGFALKLNTSGGQLLYSTLLPDAFPTAVAVNVAGQATLAGFGREGFPTTPNAFRRTIVRDAGESTTRFDAVVAKLDATGTSFVYSTFLGGGYDDYATGIALDGAGSAYVTGYTVRLGSIDQSMRTPFPATRAPFQTDPRVPRNSIYAFATKFDATGGLGYSALLGEAEFSIPFSEIDVSPEIAVDRFGNSFIAGTTRSPLLPTTFAAYQTSIRTHNPTGSRICGFVMSLNSIGTQLLFSTYFGGGNTRIYGLSLDKIGNPCITGLDLPEDYDPSKPESSFGVACFAARLDLTLSYLLNINRFHLASPTSMALDPAGNAYVTGTAPFNFPTTPNALQQNFAGDRPFTGPGRPSDKSHNFVLQIRGFSPPLPGFSAAHVSAASFKGESLAADSIVAAFGNGMTESTAVATSTPLPTTLSGLQVIVRDSAGTAREAPLFFISPNQVNYLIPTGTANGPAIIDIASGEKVFMATMQIETTAGGLFSANANGQGVAAAVVLRLKADNSTQIEPVAKFDQTQGRFEAIPIDLGPADEKVFLILFGTGLRQNAGLDKVAAEIGGIEAQVTYAGKQGALVGLDQVNLILPRSLIGRGEVSLLLKVDGKILNAVTVRIK